MHKARALHPHSGRDDEFWAFWSPFRISKHLLLRPSQRFADFGLGEPYEFVFVNRPALILEQGRLPFRCSGFLHLEHPSLGGCRDVLLQLPFSNLVFELMGPGNRRALVRFLDTPK